MFTSITNHAGALVTAIATLAGAAILYGSAAKADPYQDDQFLALLDQKEIPALSNVPRVIAAAHKVCRKLDGGMPVNDIVDGLRNDAYDVDPTMRRYPARITTTMTRFVSAAVQIYCPYDQSKITSILVNPVSRSNEPTNRVAAHPRNAVDSGIDMREPSPALKLTNIPAAWQEPTGTGAVRLPHSIDDGVFVARTLLTSLIGTVPVGDPLLPNPPPIPAPPPAAQILTPPPPIAAPPPPQQPLAPPEPPPPQQVQPPADAPPGSTAGGGDSGGSGSGGGGNGGGGDGGPVEPSPARPTAPGFIRLAP